ncbi:MAG: GNAT family N-acetyltransferase [Thiotrichaceae bacterium]|nr:GNAT family N-acetyltransferase [Thiotrichaceae bacterium]
MKLKIITINEDSKHLESVIKLGDSNSKTLGFFPKLAFKEFAKNRKILVAIDENTDIFLGYLLHDANKRIVSIVHFCIDSRYRGQNIAKCLFSKLKNKTDNGFYDGIRVHCRRDYGIDAFWKELGFHPRSEKSGRGKKDTILTVWWYDYETLSLFSLNDSDKLDTKQKVVLDANIFFDLENNVTKNSIESHELLADWLQEKVEFCLTNEIFDEINRKNDSVERRKAWESAQKYELIEQENSDTRVKLQSFYGTSELSNNDKSDIKHLEHSIASGISFFLTRDEALQKKADKIEQYFGLKILSPAHFITYLNELLSAKQYQPLRLEGKQISFNIVTNKYVNQLAKNFLMPQKEKKVDFNQIIKPHLSDTHSSQVKILKNHDELLGLVIFCSIQQELEIPILRIRRNLDISSTLAQFLVNQILQYATDNNKNIIKISDKYIVEDFLFALEKHGFIHIGQEWYKINVYHVGDVSSLQPHLDKIKAYSSDLSRFVENKLEKSLKVDKNTKNHLLPIEYALYPAKIIDIDIPTFIVSIKPIWAMNLFDYRLGEQDLIGAKLNTLFNIENVYYCSNHRKIITAPSRVLWYISKGDGKFQGTQFIRACSYIEEVHVDTPKNLFRKFKHLGIYEWRDVFEVAKNNVEQTIMTFKFTKTELFSTPLSISTIKAVYSKFSPPQKPISIPNDVFYKLYQIGVDKNS